MALGNTLVNALIGAVVAVVLSFVPLSPALGGAVAGYLQRGETRDGLKVGALSGAVAAIPLVGIAFVVAFLLTGVPDPAFVGGVWLLLFAIVAAVLLYSAGLAAIGGVLGVYLADEFGGRSSH